MVIDIRRRGGGGGGGGEDGDYAIERVSRF